MRALKPDWTVEQTNDEANRLFEEMTKQPALNRLLGNSLILRLSAEVYSNKGEIARNRAGLYKLYTKDLWERAKRRGAVANLETAVISSIELLAWQLQTDQEQNISDEMRTIIHEEMGLVSKIGDKLVFGHLTLQEYFVGQRLARAWKTNRNGAWAFLRLRLHIAKWREPILLMSGILNQAETNDLINRIIHSHSLLEDHLFRDKILAITIIGEGLLIDPYLVKKLFRKILWINSFWEKLITGRWLYLLPPGQIWGNQIVRWLIKLVPGDRDSYNTEKLIESLGLIGETSVPILLSFLKHGCMDDRWKAATTLGDLRVVAAIPDFEYAIKHDWYYVVNRASVRALGKTQSVKVLPLLRELIYSQVGVEDFALVALGEMKSPEVIPDLFQAAVDGKNEYDIPDAISEALSVTRKDSIDYLLQALVDEKKERLATAARLLGKLKAKEAIPELIKILNDKDEDEDLLSNAIDALVELEAKGVIPYLQNVLINKNENEVVRRQAIGGLSQMMAIEAVIDLQQAFKDENQNIRFDAIRAIGHINFVGAVPDLIQALNDENKQIRCAAAEALGEMKIVDAIPGLVQVLYDKDTVRCATQAILKINAIDIIPDIFFLLLERSGNYAAANALKELGPDAIVSLRTILKDNDEKRRKQALWALGLLRVQSMIPEFCRALKDKDLQMRLIAIQALGEMEAIETISDLRDLLNDDNEQIRQSVIRALGSMKAIDAIPDLHRALKDENAYIRDLAYTVLNEELEIEKTTIDLQKTVKDKDVRTILKAIGQWRKSLKRRKDLKSMKNSEIPGLTRDIVDRAFGTLVSNIPSFRNAREYSFYVRAVRKLIIDKDIENDKSDLIQYLETLHVNKSLYQDPFQILPVLPLIKKMKKILIILTLPFLIIASVIITLLFGGIQEIISPAVKAWLLTQELLVIIGVLILVSMALFLIPWIIDNLRDKLSK